MKTAKICIVLTFLLAFTVCISAQNTQTINSLQELSFLEEGKIKSLQFTVSTKEDVKKIFGENCERNCGYEENWEIYFNYYKDKWISKTTVGDNELIYKPKPEFWGKLSGAILYPKTKFLLSENIEIPKEFECTNNIFISADKIRFNSLMCIKDKKIIYSFYNETTADGRISKGQLIFIQFAPSKSERDKVSLLIEN